VEIKNLNSFRAVSQSVAHEIARQTRALESGETVLQETRLWDDERGVTEPMRRKETAMDYRYFPEPDLAPLVIDDAWIERVRAELPELAEARRQRFIAQYGLPAYGAGVLTGEQALADFFEAAVRAGAPAKAAANWVTVQLLRLLNERQMQIAQAALTPQALAELVSLVESGAINALAAKTVFARLFEVGGSPAVIVGELGLAQISDEDQLAATVDTVIAESPDAAANFRGGNERSLGFLVGQVMRKSGKRANPQLVNKLLRERLSR
jgi:aspartyl-tRNA(Asn)/glutamyl-tRNA(Gln) amidotransferase subunit B